jgi:hypothetical protein
MPGKSQHSRRQHFPQGKKKKGRRSSPGVLGQRQTGIQIDKSVAQPKVAASLVNTPTQVPVLTPVRYSYVLIELRRTGILAGIMLAILVVLSLVLS